VISLDRPRAPLDAIKTQAEGDRSGPGKMMTCTMSRATAQPGSRGDESLDGESVMRPGYARRRGVMRIHAKTNCVVSDCSKIFKRRRRGWNVSERNSKVARFFQQRRRGALKPNALWSSAKEHDVGWRRNPRVDLALPKGRARHDTASFLDGVPSRETGRQMPL
jgi:hypothetical protein